MIGWRICHDARRCILYGQAVVTAMRQTGEWRDFLVAAMAVLVAGMCIGAAIYRASIGDRAGTAMLCLLGLGVSIYGLRIAMRRLWP